MRMLSLIALLCLSSPAYSGEWRKLGENTLWFVGDITEEDVAKFQSAYNPKIKTIMVSSGGGPTEPGIALGELFRDKGVRVIVNDYCLSSCANYLFLGAKERQIRSGGFVCFHGSHTTSTADWKNLVVSLKKQGATDEAIENFKASTARMVERERDFYQSLGVNEKLFNMRNYPGYSSTCPTTSGFRRYGVRDIVGEVDEKMARQALSFQAPVYIDAGLDALEKNACKVDLGKFLKTPECESANEFKCLGKYSAHLEPGCRSKLGVGAEGAPVPAPEIVHKGG